MIKESKIRLGVFWPPFILIFSVVALNLINPDKFLALLTKVNNSILNNFSGMFCFSAFLSLVAILLVFVSPLGKLKIGGENANPILSKWKWFSITLCTTIAAGVLFWGTAEPLHHILSPPSFVDPEHVQNFAMETMFLHWTFTPYAVFTVPSLVFSIVHYNYKGKFSLISLISPLLPKRWLEGDQTKVIADSIDAVCLYALAAGMSASLGTGILTLCGGVEKYLGVSNSVMIMFVITCLVVATFTLSSISGLQRGIRILSDLNAKIFFFIALFVLIVGPFRDMLSFSVEALGSYIVNIFPRTLAVGESAGDMKWVQSWTVFYWAVWMTWAPVTALFLGKLGVGYTVRQFLVVNFLCPSLFSMVWMGIFSGTAISFHNSGIDLQSVLQIKGSEQVVYAVFDQFPWKSFMGVLFFFATFLSFVTAADSNSSAMSKISLKDNVDESSKLAMIIKISWGAIIGAVAFIMVSTSGVEGVKMSSNLGGLPAMLLLFLVTGSLFTLIYKSFKKQI